MMHVNVQLDGFSNYVRFHPKYTRIFVQSFEIFAFPQKYRNRREFHKYFLAEAPTRSRLRLRADDPHSKATLIRISVRPEGRARMDFTYTRRRRNIYIYIYVATALAIVCRSEIGEAKNRVHGRGRKRRPCRRLDGDATNGLVRRKAPPYLAPRRRVYHFQLIDFWRSR